MLKQKNVMTLTARLAIFMLVLSSTALTFAGQPNRDQDSSHFETLKQQLEVIIEELPARREEAMAAKAASPDGFKASDQQVLIKTDMELKALGARLSQSDDTEQFAALGDNFKMVVAYSAQLKAILDGGFNKGYVKIGEDTVHFGSENMAGIFTAIEDHLVMNLRENGRAKAVLLESFCYFIGVTCVTLNFSGETDVTIKTLAKPLDQSESCNCW